MGGGAVKIRGYCSPKYGKVSVIFFLVFTLITTSTFNLLYPTYTLSNFTKNTLY